MTTHTTSVGNLTLDKLREVMRNVHETLGTRRLSPNDRVELRAMSFCPLDQVFVADLSASPLWQPRYTPPELPRWSVIMHPDTKTRLLWETGMTEQQLAWALVGKAENERGPQGK